MNRRDFTKSIGQIALVGMVNPFPNETKIGRKTKTMKLQIGDQVGLISPGGAINNDRLEKAKLNMTKLGLVPVVGVSALEKYGYIAGTDDKRVADIHSMYADPSIKAIWCLRGGYGCTRLLPLLDFKLIKKNPKPIIGYSDITALLVSIYQETGQKGYHANIAATDWEEFTFNHTKDMLFSEGRSLTYQSIESSDKTSSTSPFTINSGVAEGKLIGGNLSLLAAMTGTPYQPKFKKKIVFIEDVEEKPYRVDRMLTQLIQGTDLRKAEGIVLGHFADCEADEGESSLTLKETLTLNLAPLGIPTYYGAPFGHIKYIAPLQIGERASIDANLMTLSLRT